MRRLAAPVAGVAWAVLTCASPVAAQLAPLAGADRADSPWQRAGLPDQAMARTRFGVVTLEGERVLQVEADNSYGNLVHPLPAAASAARQLSWRWRIDRPNLQADLRRKAGDDAALKVCVLFDLPDAAVPFFERQLLRLARERTGERLPAATVCYVWDANLASGTVVENPYSRRVRTIVLQGAGAPMQAWRGERRDLAADFLMLFGDESRGVPPLSAVAVGADADNTHGRSLAHIADLALQ
ncbi:DUF3047 domain-containing protein [Ideonella sp. A 288]|uniref:DUF3047 domain-containing protein n=1 Tax=Ideonella sp. A 288 TaxID=1962181 RepID=UPI001F2CAE87|nr:DUF3047 domain-containing protein [Ideonella sp. A 288]